MNKYALAILEGFVINIIFLLPMWLIWFIVYHIDAAWNEAVWQPLFHRNIYFLVFFLTTLYCYAIGRISRTKIGLTVFTRLLKLLLKKAKGAVLAPFQSGVRPAFLMKVHKSKRGYYGSVLFLNLPIFIPQLLKKDSLIQVNEIETENGIRYELISVETALRQEFSCGVTVPDDAYKNTVEITFGEFAKFLEQGS